MLRSERRGLDLKTAVGVLVLAGLAVGVVLLWPTAVPNDLVLGDVDSRAVFGAELVERAERYERFLYALWALSQIALLATLWIYARKGAAFTRESAAGPIGTGMLLGMLGLAIVWLVNLPFRLVGHWWALRYDVSDAGYVTWILEDWILLAAQFVSLCLALLIVMGLARRLGDNWWLPGAAAFVAIAALFTFVSPYLDYTTDPLRDETLVEAADRYEDELGLPDVPLYVQEVSQDTEQANAYAYGFGPTRRIVFWDTVLDDPFDNEEQQVVLAHELAHHSHQHLMKGIGWFAIFALPGAFILMIATKGREGMGAAEAVPLALIVAAVFQLATAPAANWVTRRMEAEADWKALEVTRDPGSVEGAMVGFSETSLGDPDPPDWVQIMLGTHPPLADRVAMARAWAKARQTPRPREPRNPTPRTARQERKHSETRGTYDNCTSSQYVILQSMKLRRITRGGQISLPANVRHRWNTGRVGVEDLGDRLVITPIPDDPIAAARGALEGRISSVGLRAQARKDEAAAEARR